MLSDWINKEVGISKETKSQETNIEAECSASVVNVDWWPFRLVKGHRDREESNWGQKGINLGRSFTSCPTEA